jgi:putative ABC transport system ATP-binding protein
MTALIEIDSITKTYGIGETVVHALHDVSLSINEGEYVAIMGASGSGKSTLMNILGCLDTPTSGSFSLRGIDVSKLSEYKLAQVRSRLIGFVFQAFNLIPRTTALNNVELPLAYQGIPQRDRIEKSKAALKAVGLQNRMSHFPNELSGGQQQRVAIARALATNPALILADEPTGALDTKSTSEILELLKEVNENGTTIVVITHENEVAQSAKRVIRLRDGKIVEDVRNKL